MTSLLELKTNWNCTRGNQSHQIWDE